MTDCAHGNGPEQLEPDAEPYCVHGHGRMTVDDRAANPRSQFTTHEGAEMKSIIRAMGTALSYMAASMAGAITVAVMSRRGDIRTACHPQRRRKRQRRKPPPAVPSKQTRGRASFAETHRYAEVTAKRRHSPGTPLSS